MAATWDAIEIDINFHVNRHITRGLKLPQAAIFAAISQLLGVYGNASLAFPKNGRATK